MNAIKVQIIKDGRRLIAIVPDTDPLSVSIAVSVSVAGPGPAFNNALID